MISQSILYHKKHFFKIIFKGLSVAKKYLRGNSALLSRTFKLTSNRETGFLSLNKVRCCLFLVLETFVAFLRYIIYSMPFYETINMFFKVQFRINSNTK